MVEERGILLDIVLEREPTRSSEVFYNPAMRTDRDISAAVLGVYARRCGEALRVGDVLAGTGIRGLRYAREVPQVDRVVLNDANPQAVAKIRQHLLLNRCPPERFQVEQRNAHVFLATFMGHFHVLDIDPYGSFIPFLDMAVQSLRRGGLLGLVATDLAVPFGVYPETSLRRYGVVSVRTSFSYEAMLRIYLRAVVEACARHDRAYMPWITFYERHHVRLMGVVLNDAQQATLQRKRMGFIWHCPRCDWRWMDEDSGRGGGWEECPFCGGSVRAIGPLWLGELGQQEVVEEALAWLQERGYEEAARLVERLRDEIPLSLPYYDTHALAQRLKTDPPNLRRLIRRLRTQGFQAVRSHCCPEGLKTDAPYDVLCHLVRGEGKSPAPP